MKHQKRPSVNIVIVNWNSGRQLRECLGSIADASQARCEVVRVTVVDNASIDGSISGIEGIMGGTIPLCIIKNSENRGFAAACNQGVLNNSVDYILFINPDVQLSKFALDLPVEFLEQPDAQEYAVVGIRLIGQSGEAHRSCARIPTAWALVVYSLGLDKLAPHIFKSHIMNEWPHNQDQDIDHCIGAFYLVRHKIFSMLGAFDERYFVYLEDLDFSKRLIEAGYRTRFLASTWSYHKGGGTSEANKSQRLFYSLCSRLLYVRKHFNINTSILLNIFSLTIEPIIRLTYLVFLGSFSQIGEVLKAYRMLWCKLPEVFQAGRRE